MIFFKLKKIRFLIII